MNFFSNLISDVVASPFTLTAKVIDTAIKTVEALPDVVEQTAEKIENAFDKIGN